MKGNAGSKPCSNWMRSPARKMHSMARRNQIRVKYRHSPIPDLPPRPRATAQKANTPGLQTKP